MLTQAQKQEAQGMIDNIERKQKTKGITQAQWDDLVGFFRATLEREERNQRRACPECVLGQLRNEIAKAETEEAEILADLQEVD